MIAITKKIGVFWFPTVIAYVGLAVMLLSICYALTFGNFFNEGALLLKMPWGLVSLVDIYLGLVLFSFWVIWRENNKAVALTWAVLILILGNAISCLYVIKAIDDADGDILKFWLGQKEKINKHDV